MTDANDQQVVEKGGDAMSPPFDEHAFRFPQPLYVELGEWRDEALCKNFGNKGFYSMSLNSTKLAIKLCNRCPVRTECYNFAIKNQEKHGVWGGINFSPSRSKHKN